MPHVPAARRRDDQRENLLGSGVQIITLTVVGLLLAPIVRVETLAAIPDETTPYTAPFLLLIVASVGIGKVLSIPLIEHRRPWPFGPRLTRGPYAIPESLTQFLVFVGTLALTYKIWPGTHRFPLQDGNYVWVAIPAETATWLVAALAAGAISGVLVYFVLARIAAVRQTGASDSVAQ
jgi:hypothetical protein